VTSCLRGTKLNKYQKQRENNNKQVASSSQGLAQASTTLNEGSSTNAARKNSEKLNKDSIVKQSNENSLDVKPSDSSQNKSSK